MRIVRDVRTLESTGPRVDPSSIVILVAKEVPSIETKIPVSARLEREDREIESKSCCNDRVAVVVLRLTMNA